MTIENLIDILPYLTTPLTGVITWFVARRKRQLEGIEHLQKTVDMLVAKNCELTKEVIVLREKNTRLCAELESLRISIENPKK